MSSYLVGKAKRIKVGDARAKMLLIILSDYANEDDRAWPSVGLLAAELECNERTVQRALRLLESKGLIARDAEYGTRYSADRSPYVYEVTIDTAEKVDYQYKRGVTRMSPRDTTERGDTHVTPQPDGVTSMTPRGDTHVTDGVTPMSPRGDTHVTQTLKEPSLEHPRESTRAQKTKTQPDPQPLPAGWTPDHDAQALAVELGLDLASELVKFRDAAASSGRVSRDWQAAFRNWLRHGAELGITSKPSASAAVSHHRHSYGCDHVLALLDRDAPEPDGVACRLADLLNDGTPPDKALKSLGRVTSRELGDALARLEAVA
ncbi:helix-turn-helix domain-containing protein [Bifidobacterium thermacidophilum]|uniref:Phage replication protein n=1 Tax=Bifidobacterium thermacidophilum subsp. thermacidophilum TaxID=79262 RepID=A0A087E4F9_9BIFI|nr:helix-turn-helix domain-containing protein [Bifidobacterium thermacidophilum]KFJ02660.1 phage replication protein [Bifidobacterium thermacidophilum subsp. thermacidophilum]